MSFSSRRPINVHLTRSREIRFRGSKRAPSPLARGQHVCAPEPFALSESGSVAVPVGHISRTMGGSCQALINGCRSAPEYPCVLSRRTPEYGAGVPLQECAAGGDVDGDPGHLRAHEPDRQAVGPRPARAPLNTKRLFG